MKKTSKQNSLKIGNHLKDRNYSNCKTSTPLIGEVRGLGLDARRRVSHATVKTKEPAFDASRRRDGSVASSSA